MTFFSNPSETDFSSTLFSSCREGLTVKAKDLLQKAASFRFRAPPRLTKPSAPAAKESARLHLLRSPRRKQHHEPELRRVVEGPKNEDDEWVDEKDNWCLAFVHLGQKSGMLIVSRCKGERVGRRIRTRGEFGIPLIRGVPKFTQGGIRYSSDQRSAKIHPGRNSVFL